MRAEGGRDPPAPASKRGKVRIRFVEPLPSLAPTVGIRFGNAQHDIPAYPSETDTRLAGAAWWLSARNCREQMQQVRARRAWVYSITSSARASSDGATLRSSDVEVLKLSPA